MGPSSSSTYGYGGATLDNLRKNALMSLNILSGRVSPLLCRRRAKLAKFGISSFLHPDNKQGIGQIRPGTEDDTPTGCMSIPGGQVRSIRDLPMETLYIIDGTAMLYHAHYSRETSFQYSDATLTPKLSIELRSSLQLDMDAYRAQQRSPSEFILKHNGSKNDDADQHNALYCGALISMAAKFARFVRDVRPSYVAVAFDTGGKTFRNDM